ncbi:beta(1,3)galactosyltransferase EpsH [Sarcina sp. JB2]|uniref:Beta(1,3)galactosyltransferase EpsH n=1 Tax=Candidatus Sarcina troglodytae TaxID=2726954 RepID=A0ACD1BBE9_9CLOT|nr:PssE/Cps14G family polysaccharide biosynthesis glycosyltransferase [Sarcina sp. JB2]QPJ84748.1 beta(1,3)galactosyltransferase EpsH [Sarcina sp. JB2]
MIFITLGSQKFQFNRLLREVDSLIEKGMITKKEVFAQIGYSDYIPKNYEYKNFLDRDEFKRMMDNSNIVITHGGTGAIVGAVKKGKKVIAVPRLEEFNEHVDNHQLQIVRQFENMQFIKSVINIENLELAIREIQKIEFKKYVSNTTNIISSIENYILA